MAPEKRKKSPAFQYYPKDILADTAHLSPLADRAYRRILDYTMVGIGGCPQGRVPSDDVTLARLAGFSVGEWKRIAKPVRALFKVVEDGQFLESPRVRKELAKQRAFLREQARKSKLGNEAKRRKRNADKAVDTVPAGTIRGTPRGSPNAPSSSASKILESKPLDLDSRSVQNTAREERVADDTDEKTPPPRPSSFDVMGIGTMLDRLEGKVETEEVRHHSEVIRFLNAFFPAQRAGQGVSSVVLTWTGRIPEYRILRAIREIQAGEYPSGKNGSRIGWQDLPTEARKRVVLSVMNGMLGEGQPQPQEAP